MSNVCNANLSKIITQLKKCSTPLFRIDKVFPQGRSSRGQVTTLKFLKILTTKGIIVKCDHIKKNIQVFTICTK